jgi:hypothetical protein
MVVPWLSPYLGGHWVVSYDLVWFYLEETHTKFCGVFIVFIEIMLLSLWIYLNKELNLFLKLQKII